MFIDAIEELSREVVPRFYQEIQARVFALASEGNDERMTLQERSQTDE